MHREKTDLLTFADHPLPAPTVRPYRSALIIEKAAADFSGRCYVIAPAGAERFLHEDRVTRPFTPKWKMFSGIQYRLWNRIGRIVGLFVLVASFVLRHPNRIVIRVSNGYLGFIAAILKRRGDALVLDCCDFYFDLYREFGYPAAWVISPLIFRLERYAIQRCDWLIVDTLAQRQYVSRIFGVADRRIIALPNGVVLGEYLLCNEKDPELKANFGIAKSDIVLFYGGDISALDGLELVGHFLQSISELGGRKIKLVIMGKGNEKYISLLKQRLEPLISVRRVIFLEFRPYEEYFRYLSLADICLAPFKLTPTSDNVECGKIITYLLAGKQVIATNAKGVSQLYGDAICYFRDNNLEEFTGALHEAVRRLALPNCSALQRSVGEQFDFNHIVSLEWKLLKRYVEENQMGGGGLESEFFQNLQNTSWKSKSESSVKV